ncbi:MAG: type II toxin-antitoxin system RelE/ParE family toxin [Tepidisphaeraceae bacterium]
MKRFIISPDANDDLREIRQFTAQDNPGAARKVITRIRADIRRLAAMPGLGRRRDDLGDGRELLRT